MSIFSILMRMPALVAALVIVVLAILPAAAQTTGTGTVQAMPTAPAGISPVTIPVARMNSDIPGFRSAKFGAAEADVRAAMVRDLKIKATAIVTVESSTEKTRALVSRAADVIPVPGSGTAEVSYVFGRQSKGLIQVSLAWSKATDPKLSSDQLLANAALLSEYFRSRSAAPQGDHGLVPLVDGRFLLFRGEDAQKRTVMLIAHGPLHTNADGNRSVAIDGLWLYYVANLDAPDAFRLPEGSF